MIDFYMTNIFCHFRRNIWKWKSEKKSLKFQFLKSFFLNFRQDVGQALLPWTRTVPNLPKLWKGNLLFINDVIWLTKKLFFWQVKIRIESCQNYHFLTFCKLYIKNHYILIYHIVIRCCFKHLTKSLIGISPFFSERKI